MDREIQAAKLLRCNDVIRTAEQQPVDDPEHRRRCADAQTQRPGDDEGEARVQANGPYRVPHVLREARQGFDPAGSLHAPAIDSPQSIARALHVAEAALSFAPRLVG
jgi:hypothetical protein